ncbi:MAG TPA: hypothetical protein VGV85_03820 [Longimicrobiaceae bacterium]|nr:hypothetical protein [Longimicrobiaceae bacterium]
MVRIEGALRARAPEGAWHLYQPDPTRPGFLQPPTPDGRAPGAANNYKENSLGLLTSTVGIKNHERKFDMGRALTAEATVYALVEYQLGAIFGGRGNYASQLMGSASGAGSGSPFQGARIAGSNRETFRHDVGVLLSRWDEVARELGGPVWALWAESWDGASQLGSERLDPAFIPFARAVRLGAPKDRVFSTVWFRPSSVARVRDHKGGGVLGDPFTPFVPDPKTGSLKVRGTLRKGYDYTEVVRLLFGTDEQGGQASASVRALADRGELERGDLAVVFEGTAYEQGKTGGYHRRVVLLPTTGGRDVLGWFDNPHPVRKAHTAMWGAVGATKRALRGACRILLTGEPRPKDGDAARVEASAALLEQWVDAAYLGFLFEVAPRAEHDEDGWLTPWTTWLEGRAHAAFRASLGALPTSTARRLEREVQAESYLSYKLSLLRSQGGGVGEPYHTHPDDEPESEEEE